MNQIINADCMAILPTIKNKSVDLVLTDIPYNEVNRPSNGLRNLDKVDADTCTFDLEQFVSELVRICSGSLYIFCGTLQISQILMSFRKNNLSTRLCVWEKTNPSPMNGNHIWLSGLEFCAYGKNKNAIFNQHCKNAVWRFASTRNKNHPTQKPLPLFEHLILTSTKPGDLVFDPCMGCGTAIIAAKKHGRGYLGIEISKEYFDVSEKRLSNYSTEIKGV